MTSPVPWHPRLALAVLLGLLAGGMRLQVRGTSDFGQVWYAARAILHGDNPYSLIGPGRAFAWDFPFLYPLPAAVAAVPLAPFSEPVASALFVCLGAACLAWTLMRFGYGPLFGFFALPVKAAIVSGQWTPLLAASLGIPALSVLLAAKPTVGAALFIAQPRRLAVVGGVVLAGIAFLAVPTWLTDWRHAVAWNFARLAPDEPFRTIVSFRGGPVVLLALLRWRRAEARLVAALACVPLSVEMYDPVPLLLVPRTFAESAALMGLSYLHPLLMRAILPEPWTRVAALPVAGALYVALLYLPATLMILRRPNESP